MTDSVPPIEAIEKWEDDFERLAEAGLDVSPEVQRLLDHYQEMDDR